MHMVNPNELRSAKISAVIGGHPVCRRPSAARSKASDDLATTNLQCGVRYVEWCDIPRARTIAFLLAAATSLAAHNNSALAETRPCRSMEYERNAYIICEVDLRKQAVRLYWKRSDGTPYAYLSALPRALEGEAGRLLFATNAGMFDPALKPVGLYVEQGRELVHVNTRSG
jgi:hypothetical protein